jgi:signal peptidase II
MVLLADQASKIIVMKTIPANSIVFKPNTLFWITHERNEGLVGGMFQDNPIIPFVAPLLATGVLAFLFTNLLPSSKLQNTAYAMVAGGAIGNIIDRFCWGSVTDFLQFHFYFIPFEFPWKYYPAFNVADMAICSGVFVLVLTWHLMDPARQKDKAIAADADTTNDKTV